MSKEYKEFLEAKIVTVVSFGTEIDKDKIKVPTLFDFMELEPETVEV